MRLRSSLLLAVACVIAAAGGLVSTAQADPGNAPVGECSPNAELITLEGLAQLAGVPVSELPNVVTGFTSLIVNGDQWVCLIRDANGFISAIVDNVQRHRR
jgi:hypothetical protein